MVYVLTLFISTSIFILLLICNTGNRPQSIKLARHNSNLFKVFWNIPSQYCLQHYGIPLNLSQYGIKSNDNGSKWIGNTIAIFYQDQLGLYPSYAPNGSAINGGLPQLVDMSAHIHRLHTHIDDLLPNHDFPGLGIVDWESWRPSWSRNWDSKQIYQRKSIELVQQQHPEWSRAKIEAEAEKEFERGARLLMVTTLEELTRVRPFGKWGFYLFPECYNYQGETSCSVSVQQENDKLSWLFEASSALYPSAYLNNENASSQLKRNYVHGQVQEALRIKMKFSPTDDVYLYSTIYYGDTMEFYTEDDLKNTIGQSKDLGASGVVLWGRSALEHNHTWCLELGKYLDEVLGPYLLKIRIE